MNLKRQNFWNILLATVLLLDACVTPSTTTTTVTATTGLRLYVFDCGTTEIPDISKFHPGVGEGQRKRLAGSCYLIQHPQGTIIWDTGLPDSLVQMPNGKTLLPNLFIVRMTKTLSSQLKEIGVDPSKITYLGISHVHRDHIGNVGLFPNSTLLMQKEEYAAAFGDEPGKFGFHPESYAPLGKMTVKKLEGDYDVFNDGIVVIKRTLGHTPGHQALFIRMPKTGNILLSGDLVHLTENWKNKWVPAFNFDKVRSVQTMEEIKQFLEDNHATLWIQHDPEQNIHIRHAPDYYE